MNSLLILASGDQIAVATRDLAPRESIALPDGTQLIVGEPIPFGFKIAIRPVKAGEKVYKYSVPIGSATRDIEPGERVHVHNLRSDYIETQRR